MEVIDGWVEWMNKLIDEFTDEFMDRLMDG
jgi:hypothetical protein